MDGGDIPSVTTRTFSWYDYILFIIVLLISALIGIYLGCFGKKQSTKSDYLMGGRKMKPLPIAISLVASNSTGIYLLGLPADVYRYGASFWLQSLSLLLLCIVSISIYLPVFYNLGITSIYEYLEMRFDNKTRMLASFLFTFGIIIYLPAAVYVPVLACSTATGLSIHLTAPIICGICIFYTAIGGLKAVVWTDTLQLTITVVTFIAILVMGVNSVGGFSIVWQKAVESRRLDIFDFDPDPTKRDSFWIVSIGVTVLLMSYTTVDQSFVQKFVAISNFRDSALSLIYFAVGKGLVDTLCILIGLTLYAKYATCDPLMPVCTAEPVQTGITHNVIKTNDQLLPYFVMDTSKNIFGFSGLFVAGIVSAALSCQSALLNCIAGTIYEDFISKLIRKNISEKSVNKVLKLIVVVTGIICTSFVYIIPYLGDIFPLVVILTALVGGPVLGIFSLGLFFPRVNTKGAFYGGIFGIIFGASIIIPAKYYELQGYLIYDPKPFSAINCLNDTILKNNSSNWFSNGQDFEQKSTSNEVPFIFRISFYYYTLLGFLACIISGLTISYLTNKDDPPVDKKLISPVLHCWLPQKDSCREQIQNSDEKEALNSPTTEY